MTGQDMTPRNKVSALDIVASSRHQILQLLLENKNGLHIDEATKTLNISRPAVQKHFLLLEKEGLIKKHSRLKTSGRPSTSYVLTDAGIAYFPKQYAWFSELFLQELKNEIGSARLICYMQKLGTKLAKQYRHLFDGKTEDQQLNLLVDLMQGLGFHALLQSDTDPSSEEINAHNCIYHDIAKQFQEICALDQAMISELLDKKIEQPCCMAKGDSVCSFVVPMPKKDNKPC